MKRIVFAVWELGKEPRRLPCPTSEGNACFWNSHFPVLCVSMRGHSSTMSIDLGVTKKVSVSRQIWKWIFPKWALAIPSFTQACDSHLLVWKTKCQRGKVTVQSQTAGKWFIIGYQGSDNYSPWPSCLIKTQLYIGYIAAFVLQWQN